MNKPLRAFIQEKHEIKILRTMTSIKNIKTALEIGCGNGHGTKLIKRYFNPNQIYAIDLDVKMIEIARIRNEDSSIKYQVMDASRLGSRIMRSDAADFGY
jgi:trans-aconitate methyltransferase